MGCFSWTYCDRSTTIANITDGAPYKLLIPKEFGGGYIKDYYQGYGIISGNNINDSKDSLSKTYDLFELQAFWNWDMPFKDGIVKDYLKWDGEFTVMKQRDAYTSKNRDIGIDLACEDDEIDKLKFPLKLATSRFQGEYESPETTPSYGDENQGWSKMKWTEYDRNKKLEEMRKKKSD